MDLGASINETGGLGRFRNGLEEGCLESLRWMMKRDLIDSDIDMNGSGIELLTGGHVNVLDFMYENGFIPPETFSDGAIAGGTGTREVLLWAKDHNIGWNEQLCMITAGVGDLTLLQWLLENGCPWDEDVIRNAQEAGHDEIVEWAIENGCPRPIPN